MTQLHSSWAQLAAARRAACLSIFFCLIPQIYALWKFAERNIWLQEFSAAKVQPLVYRGQFTVQPKLHLWCTAALWIVQTSRVIWRTTLNDPEHGSIFTHKTLKSRCSAANLGSFQSRANVFSGSCLANIALMPRFQWPRCQGVQH